MCPNESTIKIKLKTKNESALKNKLTIRNESYMGNKLSYWNESINPIKLKRINYRQVMNHHIKLNYAGEMNQGN